MADAQPWNRAQMAERLARDIPEGWLVNLGIGAPTLVAEHVPLEREVIIHSENGLLGIGPAPARDQVDPWIINAGKQYVTLMGGTGRVRPRPVIDEGKGALPDAPVAPVAATPVANPMVLTFALDGKQPLPDSKP